MTSRSRLSIIAGIVLLPTFFLCCARLWAATGGSISGTVKDQTGAVI